MLARPQDVLSPGAQPWLGGRQSTTGSTVKWNYSTFSCSTTVPLLLMLSQRF
jgi:hypothetical protein